MLLVVGRGHVWCTSNLLVGPLLGASAPHKIGAIAPYKLGAFAPPTKNVCYCLAGHMVLSL